MANLLLKATFWCFAAGLWAPALAQTRDITLSAYGPGCGRDSGGDQTSGRHLKPSQYKLDSASKNSLGDGANLVVIAAPPGVPPGSCLKYLGGKTDQCDGKKGSPLRTKCEKAYEQLKKATFYIDDLCPGCRKTRQFPNGKLDIAMSCDIGSNFRVQHASFNKVECGASVEAMVNHTGMSGQAALPASSQAQLNAAAMGLSRATH